MKVKIEYYRKQKVRSQKIKNIRYYYTTDIASILKYSSTACVLSHVKEKHKRALSSHQTSDNGIKQTRNIIGISKKGIKKMQHKTTKNNFSDFLNFLLTGDKTKYYGDTQ